MILARSGVATYLVGIWAAIGHGKYPTLIMCQTILKFIFKWFTPNRHPTLKVITLCICVIWYDSYLSSIGWIAPLNHESGNISMENCVVISSRGSQCQEILTCFWALLTIKLQFYVTQVCMKCNRHSKTISRCSMNR